MSSSDFTFSDVECSRDELMEACMSISNACAIDLVCNAMETLGNALNSDAGDIAALGIKFKAMTASGSLNPLHYI